MTQQSRSNLKGAFETGDIPVGSDFANLIDSAVNLVDTTAQVLTSNLQAPGLVASTVSADNAYQTNTFSNLVRSSAAQHKNPYAELFFQATAVHSAATSGFAKLSGLVTAHTTQLIGFTHNSAGRMTYTGATSARFFVQYNIGLRGDRAGETVEFAVFKNSAVVPSTKQTITIDATNIRNVVFGGMMNLVSGDFVEPFINVITTSQMSFTQFSFNAVAHPVHWDY